MRWKGKREGKSWSKGRGRAFMDGTVTSKLWQIKKGISNRGQAGIGCMLDTGTFQRQKLSDLIRNIKGKLARATSWLPCQGG